jgi:hypothetical protein
VCLTKCPTILMNSRDELPWISNGLHQFTAILEDWTCTQSTNSGVRWTLCVPKESVKLVELWSQHMKLHWFQNPHNDQLEPIWPSCLGNMLSHNSGYLLQISLETRTPLQKYAQENQQRNLRKVHLERCTWHPILLLPNATGSRVT